jgi:hypothetical protein
MDDVRLAHRSRHDDIALHGLQEPLVARVLSGRLTVRGDSLNREIALLKVLIAETEDLDHVRMIFKVS